MHGSIQQRWLAMPCRTRRTQCMWTRLSCLGTRESSTLMRLDSMAWSTWCATLTTASSLTFPRSARLVRPHSLILLSFRCFDSGTVTVFTYYANRLAISSRHVPQRVQAAPGVPLGMTWLHARCLFGVVHCLFLELHDARVPEALVLCVFKHSLLSTWMHF